MRYLVIAILIFGLGVFIPSGECLRTSPDAKTPEEASSKSSEELKDLLRQRDISKREADKRIKEKEAVEAKRAETVEVRVHAGGMDPMSKNKKVIMTTQMSKADLKAKNFAEVHRRAQESRATYRQSQPRQSSTSTVSARVAESADSEPTGTSKGTLILLGAMGAAGLWYVRQKTVA